MIYFVTARSVGRVKIGLSDNPAGRFVKMQVDSPVPLTLERVCPGEIAEERLLHEKFAADRAAGEWFVLSGAIDAHMATLPEPESKVRRLRDTHAESALIDALGPKNVSCRFRLTPQLLHMWRKRGIPQIKRIAFAKFCADRGVVVPADFFEAFEAPRTAA